MKCLISGSRSFEKIFSLPRIGIFMRVEKRKKHFSIKKKIDFFINKDTGTVQINPKINPRILYHKAHGSGTIGDVWKKHHKIYYNLCKKYLKGTILEIGGGENSILQNKNLNFRKIYKFYSFGKNLFLNKKNKKIVKIDAIFNKKILNKKKINNLDLVIHSHLFEHIINPDNFLKTLYSRMNNNSFMIFSIPNMKKMVEAGMPNAVFFEHPHYYDDKIIELLLNRNGFKIKKKLIFGKKHSIMYIVKKIKNKIQLQYNLYKINKKKFLYFKEIVENNKKKILKYIEKNTNKNVYLFGAHIFSQLILSEISNNKIKGVVDNDKKKQNKYLYGTQVKVYSLEVLKKNNSHALYLNAGDYENEITAQVRKINKDCVII